MKLSPALYSDLIGKPFARGGRGPDFYDCYGVVREVFKRLGKETPDAPYSDFPIFCAKTISEHAMEHWVQMPAPDGGVAVVLRVASHLGTHVGMMLDERRFLHTLEQMNGVHIAEIDSPLWKKRALGFYRPKEDFER